MKAKLKPPPGDSLQPVDHKADSLSKIKSFQDSIQLVQRKDSILLKTTQNILDIA
jgi:hypothetical protein